MLKHLSEDGKRIPTLNKDAADDREPFFSVVIHAHLLCRYAQRWLEEKENQSSSA